MKIDFARPDREHEAIREPLEAAAVRVLRSGRSILGEEVSRFEQTFAKNIGARFAVGVSSGTDALATSLHALGVEEGDEVIVGVFGFVSAPEAIVRVGARPVFVDVEPIALALDTDQVARAVSPRTRAVISVDLFGVVHDLAPLRLAAPGICVIEDAAQALGATLGTSAAGTLGDVGIFSFFPSKALGAAGDGGACTTNDETLALRMAQVRSHGIARTHVWDVRGGNYRLDALQAAILAVKLDHWPARLERRKAIGRRLLAAAELGGALPIAGSAACSPVFAPLALRVADGRRNAGGPKAAPSNASAGGPKAAPSNARDDRLAYLREKGIDARVHYPTTLAACPPFSSCPGSGHYPEAERATRELLSVPCHPEMTDEEVTYLEAALASPLR